MIPANRFRRQLRLLDLAAVETGLTGWDDRWFYLEYKVFNAKGELVAFALARAMFPQQRQHIPTLDMLI